MNSAILNSRFLIPQEKSGKESGWVRKYDLPDSDRGGCMDICKGMSAPAIREAQVRAAKEIINKQCELNSKRNRKSYAITNHDGETDQEILFFGKRGFSRG